MIVTLKMRIQLLAYDCFVISWILLREINTLLGLLYLLSMLPECHVM